MASKRKADDPKQDDPMDKLHPPALLQPDDHKGNRVAKGPAYPHVFDTLTNRIIDDYQRSAVDDYTFAQRILQAGMYTEVYYNDLIKHMADRIAHQQRVAGSSCTTDTTGYISQLGGRSRRYASCQCVR
ncbi:hypothetical protein H113_04660 [Trichophyton rubrum MR1459]|uniref:Uncharacterized protein n=1 Tax=Trichophyton rubrum CBS 288.86 TaxID=1215330 RepID=A0A022W249_TRIRU|nr:hypothetical protein H100_04632 [Trichophyton rubrum MR850]EZF41612.1 hypothetical protein H102_04619 [Trichophyton rubrum CBS 100081]EZF52206.1 hypothetical protein H103_04626 [Trichophyton rubrum CBS 288.86]EZF84177.1 hypothetical protein H110_04620 [Trichophyton rubrum MR1448]EZF94900.1 hypothetical protein H113_04660 [Trichophyton rubrum MR1459]EZG05961.1 hypothetical protein H106_04447 [Trichophyton rubrum CBS 735.88]EZG16426.1 hypothetical protein H107_04752 [Trichophyton rubrum CBS 